MTMVIRATLNEINNNSKLFDEKISEKSSQNELVRKIFGQTSARRT